MKLSNSCSNWLYNMVLGGSSWSLDIEKKNRSGVSIGRGCWRGFIGKLGSEDLEKCL